jgi:hypothetical protein
MLYPAAQARPRAQSPCSSRCSRGRPDRKEPVTRQKQSAEVGIVAFSTFRAVQGFILLLRQQDHEPDDVIPDALWWYLLLWANQTCIKTPLGGSIQTLYY